MINNNIKYKKSNLNGIWVGDIGTIIIDNDAVILNGLLISQVKRDNKNITIISNNNMYRLFRYGKYLVIDTEKSAELLTNKSVS